MDQSRPEDKIDRALESDAPLSATVHQRDLGKKIAEAQDWHSASVAGRSVTINRPRQELYDFWRDFRNLPRFMENLEEVELGEGLRSRWVVKAPGGDTVDWTSVITEDRPGEAIAWESLPDADIPNTGRIEFRDAPGGRGTVVSATLAYEPPAGDIGKLFAKLFQREPKVQARRELRRFKQLMETGEISTARRRNDQDPIGEQS